MRHGKQTIQEARDLVSAMRKAGVPAFSDAVFSLADRDLIADMVNKAKRHNSIQETWCSRELDEETRMRTEGKEEGLENDIREIARKFGLTVHFDGDPRGFTVKLHAQGFRVYNTWGGVETGYGIGLHDE